MWIRSFTALPFCRQFAAVLHRKIHCATEEQDVLGWGIKQFGFTLTGVFLFLLASVAQEGPTPTSLQDIVLVLDNSGSMKENDPAFLTKAAAKELVRRASAGTHAAVVIFDSTARLVAPLTPLSEKQAGTILARLDQIDYRGLLTDIPAAMERAVYELKLNSRPEATKSVIFLTDGIVDTGDPAKDLYAANWLRQELAADAARQEIKFFGIALGEKADFHLLQSLALTTKGDYFRAREAEEVRRVFDRIRRLVAPAVSEPSPNPEPLSQAQEELPAFPTLEVMREIIDKENIAANSPESLGAPKPLGSTEATARVEQQPVPDSPLQSSNPSLMVFVLACLAILMVTTVWVLALRTKRVAAIASANQTPIAAREPVPSACLHDVKKITGKKEYVLSRPLMVLGRVAPDPVENANSVVINNATVSRRHALIEYKDHSFWIIDQRSGNGTFLNDQRITEEIRLRHGDRIRVHKVEFQFELAALGGADETYLMRTDLAPTESPTESLMINGALDGPIGALEQKMSGAKGSLHKG
jgi:hypothetical protein